MVKTELAADIEGGLLEDSRIAGVEVLCLISICVNRPCCFIAPADDLRII